MAINLAAEKAGRWDVAVVIDADIFVDPANAETAVYLAWQTGKVTWAHRRWRGITEEATKRAIQDPAWFDRVMAADPDLLVEKTNPISWSCCIAIPHSAWQILGGFDERFKGWGFEDMAFQSAAVGLVGHERVEGDVFHMWHPRSPGLGAASRNGTQHDRQAILNAMLGRRYMVAVRRDHGKHDRHEPSDSEEMKRDVQNLLNDDANLRAKAALMGLPDWSDWWPTLQELRQGAMAARSSVTLIVHTDGRREYASESVRSLDTNLDGGYVTKRVIYDDSGDPEYKAWLAEEFGPLGFYVVGPAKRLGYSGSMNAMWSYLDRKCDSTYVFLAEDDFTYDEPVDLDAMINVLRSAQHVRQVALLRHAYYPLEIQAGGIIEQKPEAYTEVDGRVEHREYFTANPSLFRRDLAQIPWPNVASSERAYTNLLNHDLASRFAYLSDRPAVTHIGAVRAGSGY